MGAGELLKFFDEGLELGEAFPAGRVVGLLRQNLPALVCGDRVVWQAGPDDTGVVVAMQPRQSLLERPDADNQLKPVAANIDQILVVAAPEPALDYDLVNRYLIAAEMTDIPPVLVINKVDLLSDAALATLQQRIQVYADIGYRTVFATTKREHGLDELTDHLQDKTSIFVGQSGVGKSSLIQALLPRPPHHQRHPAVSFSRRRRTYRFPRRARLSPRSRQYRGHHPQFPRVSTLPRPMSL